MCQQSFENCGLNEKHTALGRCAFSEIEWNFGLHSVMHDMMKITEILEDTMKMLIIEDERLLADSLKTMLTGSGSFKEYMLLTPF